MQITIKFMSWANKPNFVGSTDNLQGAYLQGAYLQGANLKGANLKGAYLKGAYLQGANLQFANFKGANLQGADLQGADLQFANFKGADFQGADLKGTDFKGADFQGADFQGADLKGTDFKGADFKGADFKGADLQGANLQGADLQFANFKGANNAELPIAQTSIVPEYGSFSGWKKCNENILVQVEIPADAKRSNAAGRKCRASHVRVLKIEGDHKRAVSNWDKSTAYVTGEIVACDTWCEDRWQECAGGIHFFLTRIEAEAY